MSKSDGDPHEELRTLWQTREAMATTKANETTKRNESSLTVTLDSIGDGVISTDASGHITRMNRVAQQLTGWSLGDAQGRDLQEVFRIVNGDSGANLESPFAAAMTAGASVNLSPNTELIARNGEHFMIEDSAAPIRYDGDLASSGIVLVFRDVTEKHKLEVEFQQAKKLETIGRLAGGIAHDFNNLLAGIMGYSEMLLIGLRESPRLQGYAGAILETSQRAAKLTNQLLAFSRKGKMVTQPTDLHARIAAVVALLQSTTDKRIQILTRHSDAIASVLGDPTLLESALLNLGVNARDACPVGGIITFETKVVDVDLESIRNESLGVSPGKYVKTTVSDNGTGMSEDVRSHLFEPFFTTKEIGRGTGLGLAAVYGTIKEHHGAITVTTTEGLGTTFTLYLPLCDLSVSEVSRDEAQPLIGTGCILLVDDEAIVRETASAMLLAFGYEVLVAKSGSEALDIFSREPQRIELVILDVVMPNLSGPDTFLALKNINKDVKVIFSSGYTFDNGANDLLNDGVVGFIQKPFLRVALYKAIQVSIAQPLAFEKRRK